MLKSVFQHVASSYPTNTLTFLDLVVVKMAVKLRICYTGNGRSI